METYEFSIVASGLDRTADDFESRFYDHGCDDATVSFQKGHIILDFAREASSFEEAIFSAAEDVRKAGATIDRVEPDPLVSISDIAERSGLTRQAISLYAQEKRGSGFPSPVVRITSNAPLWEWDAVAQWMADTQKIPQAKADEAKVIRRMNERELA